VIITARQCSGGFAQTGDGYDGGAGVAGGRSPGGNVIVTGGNGPEPSGNSTVVVGVDTVGEVGLVV
jgi:hypothetical protein